MKTYLVEERERIEKAIRACKVCFVGMSGKDGRPYVLPMNFGYENGVIYLHSAQEGRSISILENNPEVCVTFCSDIELMHQHPDVACSFRVRAVSVICEGSVAFEEEFSEKEKALTIIMSQYSDKKFTYSIPAVNNVKIWRLPIKTVSAKEFGVPNRNAVRYKDGTEF
jgi:Predicted flavin-nucleotide-binding protein